MTKRLLLILPMLALFTVQAVANAVDDMRYCRTAADTVKWYDRIQQLGEVTVTTHRRRYSRKNNPAVELMRKVIAAKKRTELSRHDYYSYDKYQKLTLATNDVRPEDLTNGILSKIPDVFRQVELCPYNNKLILPVMKTETMTQKVFRRQPHSEQEIIKGDRADGINNVFQSGELLVAALKDFFTDVDIYDEQIRLLQHPFTSPISRDAIGFYRFYIIDTLNVGGDRCIRLSFVPNNRQDFGFCGDICIIDDSSYQVKRCDLTIHKRSDVNFVDNIRIVQEFTRLGNGQWVLSTDDMMVELKLFDFLQKAVVIRNTRMGNHSFAPIQESLLKGSRRMETEHKAKNRTEAFWEVYRPLALTTGERRMDEFVSDFENISGSKIMMALARILIENYIETGSKRMQSKFDIGPVLSMVSRNPVDGLRTRIGGQTTALLHPNIFFNGYYARGWQSHRNYYKAEATYSLNHKRYLPHEFPIRNITFSSSYDICTPTDKFLATDKDNVLSSFKWACADKMMLYNRQQLKLEREEENGLKTAVSLKTEDNEACGSLHFTPLSETLNSFPDAQSATSRPQHHLRTTELRVELRYSPGEKFVSTKQRRRMINLDAPVITVSHATGFDGLLGGRYRYNITEASLFKRVWMKSWGKIDVSMKAGAQWNRVPFPLLCMPASNVSYVSQHDMFNLMNNMEFLTDRYAAAHLSWDINGKIFNRIPLVRKLKWREYIGVKAMWGTLTDKNNPALASNAGSTVLMAFPDGSHAMSGSRPYVEMLAGVHNIFRCLHVEYVRRITYLDTPGTNRHGVRFRLSIKF